MNSEELKAMKRKMFQDAKDDGSIALCGMVARTLGTHQPAKYGEKFKWDRDGISIFLDDYGSYMVITFGGKEVCNTHYCNQLFVPGEWMDVVKQAAAAAKGKREREEHEREETKKRALRRELGLPESEEQS